jgi:hypothetical protein
MIPATDATMMAMLALGQRHSVTDGASHRKPNATLSDDQKGKAICLQRAWHLRFGAMAPSRTKFGPR